VTHHLDLEALVLEKGGHDSPDSGMCVMEAVAFFANEPHSDHPACASEIISIFLRNWNDTLSDADRQILKLYIPKLLGTAGTPEVETVRSAMALDWLCRVQTPAWLRLAHLEEDAEAVEALAEITDTASAKAALPTLWDAARDAAWAAAADAARDAAGGALRPTVKMLQRSALDLLDRMIAGQVFTGKAS
jgi:hypothetical protein